MRCGRCDFRTVADTEVPQREQLDEHADTAGHPLCGCCRRSLPLEDRVTCEACITSARTLLAGVVFMYFNETDGLPASLGQLPGGALDQFRPGGSDGRPLPGGDALVLLAGGSEGWAEDEFTSKTGDAGSVAFELGFWEQAWREQRREPAQARSHRPKIVVRLASGYLEVHTRWGAQNHAGFPDYLDDLAQLHDRLERATGRHERIVKAEAECFGCGADALVREITDRGYDDRWTCRRCGEKYDWERYLLAVSGRLQESDVPGWGLPEQVAFVLGVNAKTVRAWCDRELVTVACAIRDKPSDKQLKAGRRAPMRVWWSDARLRGEQLLEQRAREQRRRAQQVEESA